MQQTSYYCVGTTLTTNAPSQAIAFEPVVINYAHLHHFVLYGCTTDVSGGQQPFECSSMPNGCYQVMWAWAVGGDIFYTPSNVGILYGQSPFQHVVLQAHYDNSIMAQNQWDESGVNIYYTKTLRPNTAGFLRFGARLDKLAVLPTGGEFTAGGVCDAVYTDIPQFPAAGFTAFASFLHMHKLGRKIVTTHTRKDGTTLPNLGKNLYYDFTFQKIVPLEPTQKLMRGDNFTTYCTYDTRNLTSAVLGGESTSNEMCYNFVAYYPFYPILTGCDGTYFSTNDSLESMLNATYRINHDIKLRSELWLWSLLLGALMLTFV